MNISTNNTRNFIVFLLFFLLIASRFVGLDWGLPYPMHPDERNMVVAITQLSCTHFGSTECFNPHFYAYGQLPLYIGFILAPFISLVHTGGNFEHAALALRIISTFASIITVIFLVKTVKLLFHLTNKWVYASILFFSSVPAFVQFAHFGTTESLLMLFYSVLLFLSVSLITNQISLSRFTRYSGIVLGFALGTKVSALIYILIPTIAYLFYAISKKNLGVLLLMLFEIAKLTILAGIFFIVTSPYNIIGYKEFIGSMMYESSVGFGEYRAFYTRQFEYSVPFLFQFVSIFPYNLGWPIFILFILGFFLLPYKKPYLFLRLQFIFFFIPNSLFYAKWSRFTSPIFPLMTVCAFLMLIYLYKLLLGYTKKRIISKVIIIPLLLLSIIPGIAFTSIYLYKDVRYKTSEWIYNNMESGSYILSETANVIDVPIVDPKDSVNTSKSFTYISFNFYDLHVNPDLKSELEEHISQADYIFVPSRRVFANHTCYIPIDGTFIKQDSFIGYKQNRCAQLQQDYPEVNNYYDKLFSGELGFEKVAEFSSFPRIELFEIPYLIFPDELAEETWTVFDHPVMRIYKRTNIN